MGAATSTKKDTRKANDGSSGLPTTIDLVINFAGKVMAMLAVPQGDKLSANGNVTFAGGIRRGWRLPGDDILAALRGLSFSIGDTGLAVASSGVHQSEKGNPTVCHTAVVELPVEGGEPIRYMVQVYATYIVSKGSASLSVRAFPAAVGVSGPVVVGSLEPGEGFELED